MLRPYLDCLELSGLLKGHVVLGEGPVPDYAAQVRAVPTPAPYCQAALLVHQWLLPQNDRLYARLLEAASQFTPDLVEPRTSATNHMPSHPTGADATNEP